MYNVLSVCMGHANHVTLPTVTPCIIVGISSEVPTFWHVFIEQRSFGYLPIVLITIISQL